MQNDSMKTINLKLNNINDLFCEPDYDPFDSQSRFQSGFDELVDQVREFSLKEPLKICLTMAYPPEGADIEGTIKDALNRFCAVKIRECEKSIHEIRSQGKRDLVSGFLLSLVLIFGEFFVVQMRFLPEILTYLIATGFGIIAWVILWPPLDKLLYEWRPCRRSKRVYKYLQLAALEINSKWTETSGL